MALGVGWSLLAGSIVQMMKLNTMTGHFRLTRGI